MDSACFRLRAVAIGTLPVLAAGCYVEVFSDDYLQSTAGGTSVYSYPSRVVGCAVVAGLALVVAGWLLTRGRSKSSDLAAYGFALMFFGGPFGLVFLAPSLYYDRLVVSEHTVRVHTGFWWSPTIRTIELDELRALKLVLKRSNNARTPWRIDRELTCVHKAGDVRDVPVGDLLRVGLEEILDKAKQRGVQVERIDLTR